MPKRGGQSWPHDRSPAGEVPLPTQPPLEFEPDEEYMQRFQEAVRKGGATTILPPMELSQWGTLVGWYWVSHDELGEYDTDGKVEAQINDTTFLVSYEIRLKDREKIKTAALGTVVGPEYETTIVNLADLRAYKFFKDTNSRNQYLQWLEFKKLEREEKNK